MKIDQVCVGNLNGVPIIMNPDTLFIPNDLPHDKIVDLLIATTEKLGADAWQVKCLKARIVRRMRGSRTMLN